jgi:mono/diheme cytochrome c family protein
MKGRRFSRFSFQAGGCVVLAVTGICLVLHLCQEVQGAPPWLFGGRWTGWGFVGRENREGPQALSGTWYRFPPGGGDGAILDEHGAPCTGPNGIAGNWYWMRSPEQERVVIAGLFNRYCIRCHGVDGRGIWDIPGVPDFTNHRWQLSRSDDQIARIVMEGRGAVMPPFRGALSLEEAWAMARYLRTFDPSNQIARPDLGGAPKTGQPEEMGPAPKTKK